MCDTIGRIISKDYAIFGKNSDRAVNEPQVVEYYPAKDYGDKEKLKCTYIEITQARHTNAIVLSRPSWIWGGEIGVNEYGVCIGNEAVFTKGKYGEDALIGMDLLRLGLERGDSAKSAMDVIIQLLQEYGQGGNCGYDSSFHYDNSYLIMDRKEIYVLETVNKDYVYKKYERASISNILSIEEDGDVYKDKRINFKKTYSDLVMTTGSKGKTRSSCSRAAKLDNLEDMFKILRSHNDNDVFLKGSVGSVCMHASSNLTADQTTMSMVVELKGDDIIIWTTASSLPCVSLFKPHKFNDEYEDLNYWYQHEQFNRKLLCSTLPEAYYEDLYLVQDKIINKPEEAKKLDQEFFEKWQDIELENKSANIFYKGFWNKKNQIFIKEITQR